MKKSSVIGLIFVILVFLFNALYMTVQYQNRLNEYIRPIRINLSIIHKALVNYYEINKRLPDMLEDLFKGKYDENYIHKVTNVPVNDEFGFLPNRQKRYYLPFLYDAKLIETYKNAPLNNTIIVASPRFNNKRYVLLLKDVTTYHPMQVSTDVIIVMDEAEFQKQAKIQNWQIPIQASRSVQK